MNNYDEVVTRANIIGGMNELVLQMNDENAYMRWINIVPDECTEDDLMFIASDQELFTDVCRLFGTLVEKYGKYFYFEH